MGISKYKGPVLDVHVVSLGFWVRLEGIRSPVPFFATQLSEFWCYMDAFWEGWSRHRRQAFTEYLVSFPFNGDSWAHRNVSCKLFVGRSSCCLNSTSVRKHRNSPRCIPTVYGHLMSGPQHLSLEQCFGVLYSTYARLMT